MGSAQGQCWFIRRGDKATFMIGAWGYLELARRSAEVANVDADVVYEGDNLRIIKGSGDQRIEHEPRPWLPEGLPVANGGRGNRLGAYAVCWLTNGFTVWDFMPEFDIQKARSASSARLSGVEALARRDGEEVRDPSRP